MSKNEDVRRKLQVLQERFHRTATPKVGFVLNSASSGGGIGFIGADYLVEYVDDHGRFYQGRGERPSVAWASIERQMHAKRKPQRAAAQESRAA